MATATCTDFRPHVVNQSEGARDDSHSHWADLRRKMLRRMPWCHARRTRSSAESSFDSTISVHFSILFSSFPSFHPTFRPCQIPLVAHRYVCARLPLFPSLVLVQKPCQEVSSSGFLISIELNWNQLIEVLVQDFLAAAPSLLTSRFVLRLHFWSVSSIARGQGLPCSAV